MKSTATFRTSHLIDFEFSFYFVSLVGENGAVVEPLSSFFTSGPQHAQIYLDLITRDDQTDWEYRSAFIFV